MKKRIDQDALHQTSGTRLDQARETKKECDWTRRALPNYLQGHLFRLQMLRIERHLKACPVCASELHSLRYAAETKQLLKDITPPEGMAARMDATLSSVGKLRLLLYRPLWVLLMALIAGYLYYVVIIPLRHDPDLESIERSLPAAMVSDPATSRSAQDPAPAAAPKPTAAPAPAAKAPAPSVEPLVITITPDDQSSMRRINEIMNGHAGLRKLRFTEMLREVSGSLTPGELETLFSRIGQTGRVSYSRKQFSALSAATKELIPFVLKLKDAPPAFVKPPSAVSAETPAPASAAPQPAVSSPTPSAQP